jgi:hypothetical protein
VLTISPPVRADVYWSTSAGDWSVASNWGGTPPGPNDTAYIVNDSILGGTGHLGSVTINAGGLFAPGDLNTGTLIDAGALTIAGDLNFQSGEFRVVGTGSSITSVSIAGNLALDGDPTLVVAGSLTAGPYTIASYGGTLSGQFTSMNIPPGYTVNYGTGSNSAITLSVVPEPSTATLLKACVLGLVGWAWRQRLGKVKFLLFKETASV